VETRDDRGRTDLEIDTGPDLVVVEAKRHWITPGETQLDCYAPRVRARGSGVLVSLSDASLEWAAQQLPPSVLGVPLAVDGGTPGSGGGAGACPRPGTAVAHRTVPLPQEGAKDARSS
jgi:hypothetical protein